MRKLIRRLTAWAWTEELNLVARLEVRTEHYRNQGVLLQMQSDTLVDLFREKQAKITRLHANYSNRTAPLREDLRAERIMGTLQDHLNLLAMNPVRAERMRRGGFKGKPSDGTVEGVPFDNPNEPVGEAFDSPPANIWPSMHPIARRGTP